MHSNYFVKLGNKFICFYYICSEDNDNAEAAVVSRIFENSKWSKEQRIITNCRESFTVSLKNQSIYIFAQSDSGDLLLCVNNSGGSGKWSIRTVLSSDHDNIELDTNARTETDPANDKKSVPKNNILLSPIFGDENLSLVYNTQNNDGSVYLVKQQLDASGKWRNAEIIDRFLKSSSALYGIQTLSDRHLLLIYLQRSNDMRGETRLGYREVTASRQSGYNIIHSSFNTVADYSFLATNDTLHVLYIIRNGFTQQLFYRKKTGKSFVNPQMIYEGQRLDCCLLQIIRGTLIASVMSNGQLYAMRSDVHGESFTKADIYSYKFCQKPVKSVFLTDETQNNRLFLREIYVDSFLPWDVQMVPDLHESFFQLTQKEEQQNKNSAKTDIAYDENYMDIDAMFGVSGNKADMPENGKEFSERDEMMIRLKNMVNTNREQLNEKNNQMMQLTEAFVARGNELENLKREIEELKKKSETEL